MQEQPNRNQVDNYFLNKKKELDADLLEKMTQLRVGKMNLEASRAPGSDLSAGKPPKTAAENADATPVRRPMLSEEEAARLDSEEAQKQTELKAAAAQIWMELRRDRDDQMAELLARQTVRLAAEDALARKLKNSPSLDCFEDVAEACGKGRNSAYAKNKMARFWAVFDRQHPSSGKATSPESEDNRAQVLAVLQQ